MSRQNTFIICEGILCPVEFDNILFKAENNRPSSSPTYPNSHYWVLMYSNPYIDNEIIYPGFAHWLYQPRN